MASAVSMQSLRVASKRLTISLDRTWQRYTRFLDRYGWRAQAVNTCVLVGVGDVASQLLIKKRFSLETYDFKCSLRYFGVGLVMLGPSMHVWYSSLDRLITSQTFRAAVTKMLMDQCLFLPVYVIAVVAVMGILRSETFADIREQLHRDFVPIMKTSYQIWPLLQIANFYFIPLKHRILVMNMVGLLYNTYVAWKIEQRMARHTTQRGPVSVPRKTR